jgi:hypothetical protein
MVAIVEEKMKDCGRCQKTTLHYRNNSESSRFMILIHIVMTLLTWGVWLVLLIIWKIMFFKIGGWKCSECKNRKRTPRDGLF